MKHFKVILIILFLFAAFLFAQKKDSKITVASYYFPNYHTGDARNDKNKGVGWSEWELTINCWNEWTEGSYLEPDTKNKFGYLEAVRSVFK